MMKGKQKNTRPKTESEQAFDVLDVQTTLISINQHRLPLLLIAILSIVFYANSLKNGFTYDDEFTILNNYLIRDTGNLSKLFEMDEYFAKAGEGTYRPIVTLTYFADYAIYGLKPWGYHLTNLIFHSINGMLVYVFLTLIMPKQQLSIQHPFINKPFLISLLFLSHPVLTEAVNAISFREDLLAFLFFMLTLNIYVFLRTRNFAFRPLLYGLSSFTYILALLSKEMAATLPLIMYCYEWLSIDREKPKYHIFFNSYYVGYLIITLAYLYTRFNLFYNPAEETLHTWAANERFTTIPWLILNYYKLCLFPISLSADYVICPVPSLLSAAFIVPSSIIIGSLLLTIVQIRKGNRTFGFGFFFFILALLPVSNVIPIANPFAERYLYIPMLGFAISTGEVISNIISTQRRVRHFYIVLVSAILVTYSVSVLKRNTIWTDNYTLWIDTIRKMPNSFRAHSNLGGVYIIQKQPVSAIQEIQTALRLKPDYPEAHINLGLAYIKIGKIDTAIKELQLAPNHPDAHKNLGLAYLMTERFGEAVREYVTTLKLKPYDVDARVNLGIIYSKQGRFNEAVKELLVVLRFRPEDTDVHYNLAGIYSEYGEFGKAISHYQAVIQYDPNFAEAHYYLGESYLQIGVKEKAREEIDIALKLKPSLALAFTIPDFDK